MSAEISTIGFDADKTLWHNETFFKLSQQRFAELLADFSDPINLGDRLYEAEVRNIGHYGYGVKGFTLSMIETAIEVTDERVPASVIRELVDIGRDMLNHPIDLLAGAAAAVTKLKDYYQLVLITKGDLLHQERKLAQSGLGDHFHGVEIVSEKTPKIYVAAFAKHGAGAGTAAMVGNSMKSDVLPAIAAGAWGVFVPHDLAWDLEHAEAPTGHEKFREISDLHSLPELIKSL